jgi:flavin reductase (DIM6/NTAB) family NADH-FMN oxidoreductase RutF
MECKVTEDRTVQLEDHLIVIAEVLNVTDPASTASKHSRGVCLWVDKTVTTAKHQP